MSTSVAFIDLATYSNAEKQMYDKDDVTLFGLNKYIRPTLKQCISIFPILLIILLYLCVSKY